MHRLVKIKALENFRFFKDYKWGSSNPFSSYSAKSLTVNGACNRNGGANGIGHRERRMNRVSGVDCAK